MNLRLKKLGIKNFKGVSSFVFESTATAAWEIAQEHGI